MIAYQFFKHGKSSPKQKHKAIIVFVFNKSAGLGGVWRYSINITYGILDYIFQILDTEDVPVKQIIPCLAILLQKSENDIANIIKKT